MLKDKDKKILNSIVNYIKEKNIPPTVREICEIAESSSTSTAQNI